MHHSHLRLIVAISVLCPRCHGQELNERCKSMALQYWRATSPAVTCCAESREFLPGHFFTVGLEGFGHHAFSGMGISLGVSGGIKSFPFGHKWREDGGMSSYGSPKIEEMMKYKKLLVLVRDLIDAHFSTLRRFWHPKLRPKDTLQVEADAAVRNLRMMRDQVGNISCAHKLYIPYELLSGLGQNPRDPLILELLSRFLNVDPSKSADLEQWASHIYVSGKWPEPRALNCSHQSFWKLEANLRKYEAGRFDESLSSSFVAQYRAQLRTFYYRDLLPRQPDLFDIAPAQPMSFCLPGT